MKEGGDFPFCGFPELWVDKDRKVNPSCEIFFNEKLTFKEKPTVVIKEIRGGQLGGLHGCCSNGSYAERGRGHAGHYH